MELRFKHTASKVSDGGTGTAERLAYMLLEAARIKCEGLGLAVEQNDSLRAVHRDLGLAGYYICAEFEPEIRIRCLAIAHEESDAGSYGDLRGALTLMFEQAAAASDAITDALSRAAEDHLHAAHIHAMSASESLDDWLTVL
jgi:hypothetical protein